VTGTSVLTHELTLPITQFFVSHFPAISTAFHQILSAHVCDNVTHPWAETDAPIIPTYQHYLNGARP